MIKLILDRSTDALTLLAGAVLILMMLHITADVLMRYFLAAPLLNTVEIVSTYYIVAIVFFPLAVVERMNAHIVVELLTQHLKPRVQERLIGGVALASALYFSAFTFRTWSDAYGKYEVGEVLLGTSAITVWPTRFYLPIGCGLITLYLVYKAFCLFRGDNSVLIKSDEFEAHD